jgi:hypothetical protein
MVVERGLRIGVGVAVDAAVGAGVIRADVGAFAAAAVGPQRQLVQTADPVGVESVQQFGVRAVRLLDPAADQILPAAGVHFDAVRGGDVGEDVCEIEKRSDVGSYRATLLQGTSLEAFLEALTSAAFAERLGVLPLQVSCPSTRLA